jgi:outer membrane protein
MRRARRTRHAILVLSCLVISGCVNQKREIAKYRQVLDASAPPAPASRPAEALSLAEAMSLANQQNERIAISGEDYVQALTQRYVAFSRFLPALALGNTNTWQNPPVIQPPSGLGAGSAQLLSSLSSTFSALIPSERTVDVPIMGNWNVFNGFRDVALFRAAEFNARRQRATMLDLQSTVLLDTATAYYLVLRAEQSVDVLANSLQVQEARVRDVRQKYDAGLARILDVAQTEAQAAATRVGLIEARTAVRKSRAALGFAVGSPAAVESRLTDGFSVPQSLPDLGILMQQAELGRQDIIAAKWAVQAAQEILNQALLQYLPSATFSAEYFLYRESIPSTSDWLRVLQVNLPIFTGGLIEANIRIAWSQLRSAKLAESLTRRAVASRVQAAYADVRGSFDKIAELQVEVNAAAEALRQAEQAYQAGLATNLDRIQAQSALLTAQLQLVTERYSHKLFYLELQRQLGLISTRLPGEPGGTPMTLPADLFLTPPMASTAAPTTQPAPATQPAA